MNNSRKFGRRWSIGASFAPQARLTEDGHVAGSTPRADSSGRNQARRRHHQADFERCQPSRPSRAPRNRWRSARETDRGASRSWSARVRLLGRSSPRSKGVARHHGLRSPPGTPSCWFAGLDLHYGALAVSGESQSCLFWKRRIYRRADRSAPVLDPDSPGESRLRGKLLLVGLGCLYQARAAV